MNDLQKLFISELRTTFDAEQRLVQALAAREQQAGSGEVKRMFGEHLEQARGHVARLQQVLDQLGEPADGQTCHGMEGIIAEGDMLANEFAGTPALDAALVDTAQKSEHYKISGYGTLCTWAAELDQKRIAGLLKQNLREEKDALGKLGRLAQAVEQLEEKARDTSLNRLFLRELRKIYDGEHLLVSALAELHHYAASRVLRLALRYHLGQTEKHVRRLEKVFDAIDETADRKPCDGIEGIADEAQVRVMEFLGNPALDAALIAVAQRAEHYEIAAYSGLRCWAKALGQGKALCLFQENLSDEIATDKKLSLLAEVLRNPPARRHDSTKRPAEMAELLKLATHGG